MSMNPRVKNPLILTIVSTVFLIPVLILTYYLFREVQVAAWITILVNVVIYFVVMFLVFLFYGNVGKKQ
ncbi:MAG: hypothetical protein JW997_06895 [Actinobacteria bacterium]|nr:hypothetical protein [Actinomycetota bacterium]